MAYSIVITDSARRDAEGYAEYIRDEHRSRSAAGKWLMGLYRAIKELKEMPGRFATIAEAEELGHPYRAFIYHSHRVVYGVDDAQSQVTVYRIYHSSRRPLQSGDIR